MEDTHSKAKLDVLEKLIAMMDESETGRLKAKSPKAVVAASFKRKEA